MTTHVRRTLAAAASLAAAGGLLAATAVAGPSAQAEPRGPDRAPVMGWSSWSFLRLGVDRANIEAEAKALVTTGLSSVGYRYANLDDNWYLCPGPQGPQVDAYGRWVTDPAAFPPSGQQDGIAVVASYVHRLGLKFGIYETAGISAQAVARNTPILGSTSTADQIATTRTQNNYDCGGMRAIDYSTPGAQAYVDSVVRQLASWGVDYIKLDGITNGNVPDIRAWSTAIRHSGRSIVLDTTQGSFTTKIAPDLVTFSNQWEFAPDIEVNGPDEGSGPTCNTAPFTGCRSVFPFTSYVHWSDRFDDVARWAPYGGPGGFNDYDAIEVGDGPARSGMSPDAERSQLSLWALGSAPLVLGSDLTGAVTNAYGSSSALAPADLAMIENREVIALDQDGIDARRIARDGTAQVFAKRVGASAYVGLFDTSTVTGGAAEPISTTAASLGLPADRAGYEVHDLWTGRSTLVAADGHIQADVAPEGVALYRVTPLPR